MTAKELVRHRLRNHGRLYDLTATTVMLARFFARRPHESDFRVFRRLGQPVVFADLGANRGQSALSFAAMADRRSRIVSFDANPGNERHLRLVRRMLGERFEYHIAGLGAEHSHAVFHVPVQGTRRITGEGSFKRENVGARINGAFEISERAIDIRPLDSFDLSPDVVKIDVQEFELAVLRGMVRSLAHKPLLLIEASPRTDAEILSFLEGHGYERHRNEDGRLVPAHGGTPLNWFYRCPGTFEQLLG